MKLNKAIKTWLPLPPRLFILGLYSRSLMLSPPFISPLKNTVEVVVAIGRDICSRKKLRANGRSTDPLTWHWFPAHGKTMVVKDQ